MIVKTENFVIHTDKEQLTVLIDGKIYYFGEE